MTAALFLSSLTACADKPEGAVFNPGDSPITVTPADPHFDIDANAIYELEDVLEGATVQ